MVEEYEFSFHALKKLKERELSESIVLEVLKSPEQRFEDGKGLMILQSRVDLIEGRYLLRLFVNENTSPKRIVTIYLTSKIKKYWRNDAVFL
jgi:hypothetical protein